MPPILSRQRGARERHERGGRLRWALVPLPRAKACGRMAGAAPVKPCGPDAPRAGVKFPGGLRFPGAMVSKSRSPGRARHKPSNHCAGKAGVFPAEPVCSCAFSLLPFAHETAGAARTRSFPAPSFSKRRERICRPRAKACRENVKPCPGACLTALRPPLL